MKKIKVLQVNKLYYPEVGGIEKTLQQISEGLNEKTDLEVLVCQKKGRGISERVNKVQVHRNCIGSNFIFLHMEIKAYVPGCGHHTVPYALSIGRFSLPVIRL